MPSVAVAVVHPPRWRIGTERKWTPKPQTPAVCDEMPAVIVRAGVFITNGTSSFVANVRIVVPTKVISQCDVREDLVAEAATNGAFL